jgi:hypothetical protein
MEDTLTSVTIKGNALGFREGDRLIDESTAPAQHFRRFAITRN